MIRLQKTPMWIGRLVFLGVLLAIWQGISATKSIDPIFIGDPIGIAKFLYDGVFVSKLLLLHFVWTLVATLIAFALGTAAGVLVGLLFVIYPRLELFFDPILSGLNSLPRIALAPLF